MKRIIFIFLAAMTLIFSSCGETAVLAEIPSGGVVYKTVDEKELKLEFLAPTELKRKSPAVIVLHGGGWVSGTPEDFTRDFSLLCDALRDAGVMVIPVEYRLAGGGGGWRNCLDDCEDALSFICENARDYGIDPENIGVIGYSAGGQLALMTAIETRNQVKYCVSMSGPTCLSDNSESPFYSESLNYYLEMIFPADDQIGMYQASPVIRVNRRCQSEFLLVYGTGDKVVLPAHAETFLREVDTFGIPAELLMFDGLTHSYTAFSDFPELCREVASKVASKLCA